VDVKPVVLVPAIAALVAAASLWLAPVARAGPWQRPVRGPVVRAFALAADRFARGQHRGVDLVAALGAPVRAACGGRVGFAGRVPGGGWTVSVACGRLRATYQHLGTVAVRRGQLLAAGATLGSVGRSGRPRARRPHVHLGAREVASGRYVDPLTLLGSGPRAAPPVMPGRPGRVPLGPAPRPAPGRPEPAAPPILPAPVVAAPGEPAGAPPLVMWAGLGLFGLGLPLGGLAGLRRRRRSRVAADLRARRWAPAHR
jgi:murein DD-endopeptidase MepM/ murein hydrolase activator NlpD